METIKITNPQARRFLLKHQGLYPPRAASGKADIIAYFERVGCIQYDPLNIVGHNSELVLQSRMAEFRPAMLRELLYEDRLLVDGWDKVMSIYPARDWPFFQRRRDAELHRQQVKGQELLPFLPLVREEIRERGPLSSLDLKFNDTLDWPWGPTRVSRAALETLFFCGELVIHHKVNTRKIYDFASRHLQADLLSASDPNVTEEDYLAWIMLRRIGGIGMLWNRASDAWVGIAGLKSAERQAATKCLMGEGKLCEVQVAGIEYPCYLRNADLPTLKASLDDEAVPSQAAIIAPLDNLLWDRRFIEALFGFNYRWEVYKPKAQREYGYYVLPVLYGDRFVARFEPGYDKRKGIMTIKNWWWEADVEVTSEMHSALQEAFRHFLAYLGAERIELAEDAVGVTELKWMKELT
jgi:uncharacterized protein